MAPNLKRARLTLDAFDINKNNASDLIRATKSGNSELVGLLMDMGVNVEASDEHGWAALHWASLKGHLKILELLIEKGVDVNAKTPHGLTALHCAAVWGCIMTLKLLIEKGANLNAKTDDGKTASMIAEEKGHTRIVAAIAAAVRRRRSEEAKQAPQEEAPHHPQAEAEAWAEAPAGPEPYQLEAQARTWVEAQEQAEGQGQARAESHAQQAQQDQMQREKKQQQQQLQQQQQQIQQQKQELQQLHHQHQLQQQKQEQQQQLLQELQQQQQQLQDLLQQQQQRQEQEQEQAQDEAEVEAAALSRANAHAAAAAAATEPSDAQLHRPSTPTYPDVDVVAQLGCPLTIGHLQPDASSQEQEGGYEDPSGVRYRLQASAEDLETFHRLGLTFNHASGEVGGTPSALHLGSPLKLRVTASNRFGDSANQAELRLVVSSDLGMVLRGEPALRPYESKVLNELACSVTDLLTCFRGDPDGLMLEASKCMAPHRGRGRKLGLVLMGYMDEDEAVPS